VVADRSSGPLAALSVLLRLIFIAGAAGALGGCGGLGYYAHVAQGHVLLMSSSRSIEDVLGDPTTTAELRAKLREIEELREFAVGTLGLPDNGSYRRYADVDRPALLWSVVATPALSLEPVRWCYPVIGCASYRGYFDKRLAEAFADELVADGMDVSVDPVPAYSTLGWFPDPLPSTVLRMPRVVQGELLLHELAHLRLYVSGDSAFNEAFASAVARLGIERWLRQRQELETLAEWRRDEARRNRFADLLMATRNRLDDVYSADLPDADKEDRKRKLLAGLMDDYAAWKRDQADYSGFDAWFARGPVNNARLASLATYRHWIPAFTALFELAGGEFIPFYDLAVSLAELDPRRRREALDQLLADQTARRSCW